jgi:hypothetical protein
VLKPPSVKNASLLPAALLLALAGCASEPPGGSPPSGSGPSSTAAARSAPRAEGERIRAVTLDAVDRPADSTLRAIADLGATHLVLVSFGFQRGPHATRIQMHTGGDEEGDDWYSETDAGIRALARRADSLGMGLVLKPHLWVGREGDSRLDISFEKETDGQAWQQQYRRFLLHYARLAEEVEADLLVVGTELAGTTTSRADFWRRLIADVRAVYSGKLTYAANWHEEYEAVPFWDALDYVGVQGYFPLSEQDDPSVGALVEGWQPYRRALRRVSAEAGKPVFFTELGYRNARTAAAEPWHWPAEDDAPAPRLQARLYEAFFQEVWPRPWVAGAALWKWPADPEHRRPAGFMPRGPAARAIQREFEEAAPATR